MCYVDNHDEQEDGEYIKRSVLAMCSRGASLIAFASVGEVH